MHGLWGAMQQVTANQETATLVTAGLMSVKRMRKIETGKLTFNILNSITNTSSQSSTLSGETLSGESDEFFEK